MTHTLYFIAGSVSTSVAIYIIARIVS